MLVAEELAGAAETRLHLVDDQQGLVLSAEFLRFLPVLGRRHVDALALNGFDDECGDVSSPQLSAERGDVAEGDRAAAGKKLAKALRKSAPPLRARAPVLSP